MESRSDTNTSTKKRKIKARSHLALNQTSESVISISIDLSDLTCPITQELFFDPVLAMPCGHGFESRASSGLLKSSCPTCRQDIVMFGAALDKRDKMDKMLATQPALYAQVYFNLDHFADVVRKNELNTPIGERFIKLLQHAVDHLNDKAAEGTYQNKTAIEVLASTYQGRELLRHDEKIRVLLAPESLQIQVNGKSITEWLTVEKEEPEIIPVSSTNTPGLFRSASASSSSKVAQHIHRAAPAHTVWQRVVYGNEDGVLQMIRANSALVEQAATVTDYSDRIVDDATPFQMALRAGDEVMAKKIKAIYFDSAPNDDIKQQRQAELDAQFNAVFPNPNGYATHLEEQKRNAEQFECDILNPLVSAFDHASIADLQAALNKHDNGSELCRKLREFKAAFHELSLREKVYNPNHLLKIFEKYNAKFSGWHITFNNHEWLHLDLFWRQVVGWEERYMPANYAQSFCTGLGNMVDNQQPLQRRLTLHNHDTNRDIHFFPLDGDPTSRLGSDFGVYSYGGGRGCHALSSRSTLALFGHAPWAGGGCEAFLQNLCRAKTASLGELCSPNRAARIRPVV